jgi:Rrf2 family protein
MRISARADYALRAALELAAGAESGHLLTAELLARRQAIPRAFLEGILCEFRAARLVTARRGPHGGYRLARSADDITAGDVLRAAEGPLTLVRGTAPDVLDYEGVARPLLGVWLAACNGFAQLLDGLTLAELLARDRAVTAAIPPVRVVQARPPRLSASAG